MDENLIERQRLGERIKQLRVMNGLTQEVLAERIGISPQHLGVVERGEANVTVDILFNLARHLVVHVRELFPATPDELVGKQVYQVPHVDFEHLKRAAEVIGRMAKSGA